MVLGGEAPQGPVPDSFSEPREEAVAGPARPVAWDLGDRILYVGDIAWIAKEVGWMLLVPWVGLIFGALAVSCAAAAALAHCRHPIEVLLPEVTAAFWLLGNVVWMTGELLWDTPDQQTPWALTPLLEADEDKYSSLTDVALKVLSLGPLAFLSGLIACSVWLVRRPGPHAKGAVGAILLSGNVPILCLMDIFWALELPWPALVAAALSAGALIAAAAMESGEGLRGLDRADLCWVLWVCSNALWIICELLTGEDLRVRYSAAIVALMALTLLIFGYEQVKRRAHRSRASTSGEVRYGVRCGDSGGDSADAGSDLSGSGGPLTAGALA